MDKREIKILLLLIIIFSFLLRLPGFFRQHIENDEIIFQTLVKKNSFKLRDYTLHGTDILEKLAKENYDFASFPHPPAFVYLETIFYRLFGQAGLMFVPVFASLGTIFLVFKIGKHLYSREKGLLASAIMAVCPILVFISTKIWIDSLLVFLVALSFYLMLKINKPWQVVYSGIVFSLAILTKYPAVFVLPAILIVIFNKFKNIRQVVLSLLCFFVPLLITIPWFKYNYLETGVIFRNSVPSAELIEKFPFVKKVVNRPFYFYSLQLVLVYPIYGLGYLGILGIFGKKYLGKNLTLVVWFLSYLVALTFFGLKGGGYQTRYIAAGLPGLALLSVAVLPEKLKNWQILLLFVVMTYGLVVGILNSFVYQVADLVHFVYGI
jgi:4-amino-4-deoxy-L-arabinose transferase-like glycosyltransferase